MADQIPIKLPGGTPVRLFDTRTRKVQPLVPREPGKIGVYACGPTVYQPVHIGNARPFITFHWLARFLRAIGNEVTFVANVTDINDRIYAAAQQQGIPSAELGAAMTARYKADTDRLGLGRPDVEPTVTETMDEIIALTAALIDRGHAYEQGGDVYFRVRSDERYGELSRRGLDDADQGEGLEGAELKEDPADFALWKSTKPGEDTSWESPWGRGRPAWHIECSAMGEKHLGADFEIHGGGRDLVFPHHENEEAQTRCGMGHDLARIWMHSGMLQLGEEKMSKSLGNVALLSDVLDRWGSDAVLYLFATAHYRQPLAFSDASMEQAQARVARLVETGRSLVEGPSPDELAPHRDAFFDALADDFNTTVALAALAEWVREANRRPRGTVGDAHLREMLDVLGLAHLLDADEAVEGPGPEVHALVEARAAARAAKDWAAADAARDELAALGWVVRDGADGPELIPA
ncbi:MAG: cysteine--tRNA ligase [Patulibacter minatonensis]